MTQLILASTSKTRVAMLSRAGVIFDAMAPMVDEESIKESLSGQGLTGRDIADALAEAKAVKLSGKNPGALVIGADQALQLEDGTLLDKPVDPAQAVQQLSAMAGKTHKLFSAAVIAERGEPVWRFVATSRMIMLISTGMISAIVWAVIRWRERARSFFRALRAAILTLWACRCCHCLAFCANGA
jgi:septum formation protein